MTDYRSEDGITIGLIDALTAISRVLAPRLGDLPGLQQVSYAGEVVQEAIRGARGDGDIKAAAAGSQEGIALAWGLIANAYGGNWDDATDEWRDAAVRWRDSFAGSQTGMDPNIRKDTPVTPHDGDVRLEPTVRGSRMMEQK